MKCTEKERDTCNVEKRGCEGCFYNDKIEIGDYVRTRYGIAKIINDVGNNYFEVDKNGIYCSARSFSSYIHKDYIMKHSKNIIDLVDIGDFVNGVEINEITNDSIGKRMIASISTYGDDDISFGNKDIDTIVTKEQFKNIEYRVNTKE